MTEMPKTYNPKDTEDRIYRVWEAAGFFNPDKLPIRRIRQAHRRQVQGKPEAQKNFVVMMPPPNITGSLHMGHALEAALTDSLVRMKRMQGYKTLWLPGTDHASIATQYVVEKELKKEGLARHALGREKFLERVWAWKERHGSVIVGQFRKLGVSADWSRTVFTMDASYIRAVEAAFVHYFQKGWVYRGVKVVNWCPRCATSLSDLELEYQEEKGKLWYIKYPLTQEAPHTSEEARKQGSKEKNPLAHSPTRSSRFIVVATTRPETMLGDTAVAVHPNDARYADIIGSAAVLPLMERIIPIVADDAVDRKFGTGAVKVTPAHDPTDAEIGERQHLENPQVIGEDGKMTELVPEPYRGMPVAAAREKIVEDLAEKNLLEKIEDYTHNVAHCYRCGTTIEPLPSPQWFLAMKELAHHAVQAYEDGAVDIQPERFKNVALDWLRAVRDWPISRQLWWGQRLPVWQCQTANEIKNQKSNLKNNEAENYIVAVEQPKKCPVCGKCEMERSADVFDTWFSSALWPFATLRWPSACAAQTHADTTQTNADEKTSACVPENGTDLEKFYPTQWMTSAREILHLWITRMVFSGVEFFGKAPFSRVYIHPTVLTKEGKRMSKSLGTGIDPLALIEKYGADATRFGLLWHIRGGQDIRFSEDAFMAGKKFINKVWNATRYTLGVLARNNEHMREATSLLEESPPEADDEKILAELKTLVDKTELLAHAYEFGQALEEIYHFFWHRFCDEYLERTKIRSDAAAHTTLRAVLDTSLRILHPFVPFVTEELWRYLPHERKTLLIIEQWPT